MDDTIYKWMLVFKKPSYKIQKNYDRFFQANNNDLVIDSDYITFLGTIEDCGKMYDKCFDLGIDIRDDYNLGEYLNKKENE
jgi:hypothetical protein